MRYMKLSNRCRYATIALFDIAFHSDGKPTQVRQIAERQNIPGRFLEQIFHDLRRAELVDGKRGRNGGYFLHRPPSEITLSDIIEATDGPIELNFVSNDQPNTSPIQPTQEARRIPAVVWGEISSRIREIYSDYTLEDLVERAKAAGFDQNEPEFMYFI